MSVVIQDMRGLAHASSPVSTWSAIVRHMPLMSSLEALSFPMCPADVILNVTNKLPCTKRLVAESIVESAEEPQ